MLISLARDVPAEGYRADEVHPDKICAESAAENFRNLTSEHRDFGCEHPAIIRYARATSADARRIDAGVNRADQA
jgi:hypothetical protein